MEKLTRPIYAIEIVFFVGAATLLALLALRSAIPGPDSTGGPSRACGLAASGGNGAFSVGRTCEYCPWPERVPTTWPAMRIPDVCARRAALGRTVVAGQARRSDARWIVRTPGWRRRAVFLLCHDAHHMPNRRVIALAHMASLARPRADRALDPGRHRLPRFSSAHQASRRCRLADPDQRTPRTMYASRCARRALRSAHVNISQWCVGETSGEVRNLRDRTHRTESRHGPAIYSC